MKTRAKDSYEVKIMNSHLNLSLSPNCRDTTITNSMKVYYKS